VNPYDAAHRLARALKESDEFKEFKKAQQELKADQTAKKMVLDLRGKQLELQRQKLSGLEVSKEQEERLQKLLEVVNMNLVAKRFIEAEYRAAVLLQDVQKIIGEATGDIYDEELMTIPGESQGDQE